MSRFTAQIQRIQSKLITAVQRDKDYTAMGSEKHHYQLGEPLSEAELTAFETAYLTCYLSRFPSIIAQYAGQRFRASLRRLPDLLCVAALFIVALSLTDSYCHENPVCRQILSQEKHSITDD